MNKIQEAYPTLALAGVSLSLDNETFTYQLEIQPFQLFGFNTEYMLLSEPASDND